MMESGWRPRAEPVLLEEGTHLQIGLDGLDQPEPKVWVLAVPEQAPAAFGGVVGGFPRWVVQECAQSTEMIDAEMLLLPA